MVVRASLLTAEQQGRQWLCWQQQHSWKRVDDCMWPITATANSVVRVGGNSFHQKEDALVLQNLELAMLKPNIASHSVTSVLYSVRQLCATCLRPRPQAGHRSNCRQFDFNKANLLHCLNFLSLQRFWFPAIPETEQTCALSWHLQLGLWGWLGTTQPGGPEHGVEKSCSTAWMQAVTHRHQCTQWTNTPSELIILNQCHKPQFLASLHAPEVTSHGRRLLHSTPTEHHADHTASNKATYRFCAQPNGTSNRVESKTYYFSFP